MNKYKLLLFALALFTSRAYAENKPRYENWRSTEIAGPGTHLVVATGPIYLDSLSVTSGSLVGSSFQYFNSTSTDQGVDQSTSCVFDTTTAGRVIPLKETVGLGFAYTSVGAATVRIIWDYTEGPPRGKERVGRK